MEQTDTIDNVELLPLTRFELAVGDDGCVRLLPNDEGGRVVVNLGPRDAVAEKFADWLAQMDFEQ